MSAVCVELFEKPIIKTHDELELGVDVIQLQYGDYGNFVKVVLESCGYEDETNKWWVTKGIYVSNGAKFEGYCPVYNNKIQDYIVVGKVIKNEID